MTTILNFWCFLVGTWACRDSKTSSPIPYEKRRLHIMSKIHTHTGRYIRTCMRAHVHIVREREAEKDEDKPEHK